MCTTNQDLTNKETNKTTTITTFPTYNTSSHTLLAHIPCLWYVSYTLITHKLYANRWKAILYQLTPIHITRTTYPINTHIFHSLEKIHTPPPHNTNHVARSTYPPNLDAPNYSTSPYPNDCTSRAYHRGCNWIPHHNPPREKRHRNTRIPHPNTLLNTTHLQHLAQTAQHTTTWTQWLSSTIWVLSPNSSTVSRHRHSTINPFTITSRFVWVQTIRMSFTYLYRPIKPNHHTRSHYLAQTT